MDRAVLEPTLLIPSDINRRHSHLSCCLLMRYICIQRKRAHPANHHAQNVLAANFLLSPRSLRTLNSLPLLPRWLARLNKVLLVEMLLKLHLCQMSVKKLSL